MLASQPVQNQHVHRRILVLVLAGSLFSVVQWSAEYWPLQVKFNSQSDSPLAGFSSLFLSLPPLHVINGPLLLCSWGSKTQREWNGRRGFYIFYLSCRLLTYLKFIYTYTIKIMYQHDRHTLHIYQENNMHGGWWYGMRQPPPYILFSSYIVFHADT